jgi:hypothetical protein
MESIFTNEDGSPTLLGWATIFGMTLAFLTIAHFII